MTTTELITAVQKALGVDADGIAGPVTLAAIADELDTTDSIAAIQDAVGVDADGILGPATWQAIFDEIVGSVSNPAKYVATKQPVQGRGVPPDSFLDELVAWGRSAPDEIFASNDEPHDIFGKQELLAIFGPWDGQPGSAAWLLHRKAALLEILRCLAGFESSWTWTEGVDTTNASSVANIEGQETGIFQVSHDSLLLEKDGTTLSACVKKYCGGSDAVGVFIPTMKSNHPFAMEYAARLLRISYLWDGPIKFDKIDSSLKPNAVQEFKTLLS